MRDSEAAAVHVSQDRRSICSPQLFQFARLVNTLVIQSSRIFFLTLWISLRGYSLFIFFLKTVHTKQSWILHGMLLTNRFSCTPILTARSVGPWINIQLILDLLKIFYSCWLSMLQYCIFFLIIFVLILAIFADNLWFNVGFSCWLEDSLFLLINTRHKTLVWYFQLFLLDIASTISFLFWWSLVE